jgi:hypothetical protein
MDTRLLQEHLAEAERHIALGDKHIARQIEIIDALESAGHPIELAWSILDKFRLARAAHIAHRDTIRWELSAPSAFFGPPAQSS